MNYFTLEQDIDKVLRDTIKLKKAAAEYNTNDIGLCMTNVINDMLADDNIEDLWGPEWSVFLAFLVHKIQPDIDKDTAVSVVKEILFKMVGNSNATPSSVLGSKVGLSEGDVDRIMYVFDFMSSYHGEIATQACKELSIPTPIEVTYIYTALGDEATPYMADKLCEIRPVDCRAIEKSDIPTMAALKDAYL